MNMTPEVISAWLAFQAEVKDPKRNAEGQSGNSRKFPYADLLSVLEAVRPVLHKHGLALIQRVMPQDAEIPTARTVTEIWHKSGELVAWCSVPILMERGSMQAAGSAITYGRRYGIVSLCGIASQDEDDDGAAASAPAKKPAAKAAEPAATASKQLADRIRELVGPKGVNWQGNHPKNWLRSIFGVQTTMELTLGQQQDAIELLEARVKSEVDYNELLDSYRKEKRVLPLAAPVA